MIAANGSKSRFEFLIRLGEFHGDLIIGGSFTEVGGIEANHIARWDNSDWKAMGSGLAMPIYYEYAQVCDLITEGIRLYMASSFLHAGAKPSNRIACWSEVLTAAPGAGAAPASLAIYDLSGRLVCTLAQAIRYDAGQHSLIWEGRDKSSRLMPSGVYLCRLEAGGRAETRKLALVKGLI